MADETVPYTLPTVVAPDDDDDDDATMPFPEDDLPSGLPPSLLFAARLHPPSGRGLTRNKSAPDLLTSERDDDETTASDVTVPNNHNPHHHHHPHDPDATEMTNPSNPYGAEWTNDRNASQSMSNLLAAQSMPTEPQHFVQAVRAGQISAGFLDGIDMAELTERQKIASGGFGRVERAKHHGTTVAVKFLKGDLTQEFMREIHLLARLRNEYCVLCIGAVHSDNEVGVVTEFMDGGDLHDFVRSSRVTISFKDHLRILWDVVRGLTYLHSQNIFHRDVKPHNILLQKDLSRAKLTDFGLSGGMLSGPSGRTIRYCAPEVVIGGAGDASSDMYSYGLVAFQLMSKMQPFYFTRDVQGAREANMCVLPWDRPLRTILTEVLDGQAQVSAVEMLIERSVDQDPAARWAAIEAAGALEEMITSMPVTALELWNGKYHDHHTMDFESVLAWLAELDPASASAVMAMGDGPMKKLESCLAESLSATPGTSEVSCSSLRRFLCWFGPVDGCLGRAANACALPAFCPSIGTDEAMTYIRNEVDTGSGGLGSLGGGVRTGSVPGLVRLSRSAIGFFVLMVWEPSQGGVENKRFEWLPDDGVFRFEGTGVVVASMTEAVTAGGLDATVDVVARADALKRANRSNQYAQFTGNLYKDGPSGVGGSPRLMAAGSVAQAMEPPTPRAGVISRIPHGTASSGPALAPKANSLNTPPPLFAQAAHLRQREGRASSFGGAPTSTTAVGAGGAAAGGGSLDLASASPAALRAAAVDGGQAGAVVDFLLSRIAALEAQLATAARGGGGAGQNESLYSNKNASTEDDFGFPAVLSHPPVDGSGQGWARVYGNAPTAPSADVLAHLFDGDPEADAGVRAMAAADPKLQIAVSELGNPGTVRLQTLANFVATFGPVAGITRKALMLANLPCFVPRLSAQDTYKYLATSPDPTASLIRLSDSAASTFVFARKNGNEVMMERVTRHQGEGGVGDLWVRSGKAMSFEALVAAIGLTLDHDCSALVGVAKVVR